MFWKRISHSLKGRYSYMQRALMSEFKEKSASEVWLGDKKHYLHAGLLIVILALPVAAATYLYTTDPEATTKTLNIPDEDIQDAETAKYKGDQHKILEVKGQNGK